MLKDWYRVIRSRVRFILTGRLDSSITKSQIMSTSSPWTPYLATSVRYVPSPPVIQVHSQSDDTQEPTSVSCIQVLFWWILYGVSLTIHQFDLSIWFPGHHDPLPLVCSGQFLPMGNIRWVIGKPVSTHYVESLLRYDVLFQVWAQISYSGWDLSDRFGLYFGVF